MVLSIQTKHLTFREIVLDQLKKNWVLVVFYLVMVGVLIGYSMYSGRYFALMVWVLAPAMNYAYKRFSKKGH